MLPSFQNWLIFRKIHFEFAFLLEHIMQANITSQATLHSTSVPFYKRQSSPGDAEYSPCQTATPQQELQDLRPYVLSYCRAYLRHSEDAEEACQDTMVNAMSGLSKFENRASLKTWVMKIAYHVCNSYFRRNRKQKDLFDEYDDSVFASSDPTLDQENPEITALLATLSTVQQEILRYRFVEELSLIEISIVLGYKISCIKMNYYRALEKMQKACLL